jgi:hypothetical protein
MEIKEITWQHRNDFAAIMICEHCSHEAMNNAGYNDVYYHTKVIPSFHCPNCGKNREGKLREPTPSEEAGRALLPDAEHLMPLLKDALLTANPHIQTDESGKD